LNCLLQVAMMVGNRLSVGVCVACKRVRGGVSEKEGTAMRFWIPFVALWASSGLVQMRAARAAEEPPRPRLVVQAGHSLPVKHMVPSPDGKLLATAGEGFLDANDAIILWDTATGKELRRFYDVPSDAAEFVFGRDVLSLNFSPSSHLFAATFGQKLEQAEGELVPPSAFRIWDATTGRDVCINAQAPKVRCGTIAADDQHWITGGNDGVVREWDLATGKELRQFNTGKASIQSLAVSADQQWVAAVSSAGEIWFVSLTGKQPEKHLPGLGEGKITALQAAFVPNKHWALVWGEFDPGARLVDCDRQVVLAEFAKNQAIEDIQFSPDGKWLLLIDLWHNAAVVDLAELKIVRLFYANAFMHDFGFSRFKAADNDHLPQPKDGEPLATMDRFTAAGWLATGEFAVAKETGDVDTLAGPLSQDVVRTIHFELPGSIRRQQIVGNSLVCNFFPQTEGGAALDRPLIAIANFDEEVLFVNLLRQSSTVRQAAMRPALMATFANSGGLLVSTQDRTLLHWKDKPIQVSKLGLPLAQGSKPRFIQPSATGKRVLFGVPIEGVEKGSRRTILWDVENDRSVAEFEISDAAEGLGCQFSADGSLAIITLSNQQALVIDAATGKTRATLRGHAKNVSCAALSSDASLAITGGEDGTVRVYDAKVGTQLAQFTSEYEIMTAVAISPDRRTLLACGGTDKEGDEFKSGFQVWDYPSRKLRQTVKSGLGILVAFSLDSKRFCIATESTRSATLWDAASAKPIAHLDSFQCSRDLCFSPGGKYILTVGVRGSIHLWDAVTGASIGELVHFRNDDWAIADEQGRFDASPGGQKALHWVVGNEPIELGQLKERYYEPGLSAKLLGLNPEPLRPVEAFAKPQLFPSLAVDPPTPDKPLLQIHVKNRGGGIGRISVKVGGKEIAADTRGPQADPHADALDLAVDLASDPRLVAGKPNTIEVQAFNQDGYLSSRGLEIVYIPPAKTVRPPRLWGIVTGVSHYRGAELALRYASKDAADFAQSLRLAAGSLFGADHVQVHELTSDATQPEQLPTRANLIGAFRAIQDATPAPEATDVLVLYLAGHGVNFGGAEGDFYYLTQDALSADLRDPDARNEAAVSSAELTEFIRRIPAQKQVLILDTCAAGKFVEKLTEKRELPSSQVRALERLKDRMGMHVLAGCAADQVSYEATRFAQGLLTHSLLMGMRGAALRDEEFVDVERWFGFAADEVPKLSLDLGGIQRPIIAAPSAGGSFDIGRLTTADKSHIPLQTVRPLILRASFQDAELIRDRLALTKHVNDLLRTVSARGRSAEIVFVDAEEFPGAYELVGRYVTKGKQVEVTAKLINGSEATDFRVNCDSLDPEEIAKQVVAAAQQRIQTATTKP
jgi:WD40 repeat protein